MLNLTTPFTRFLGVTFVFSALEFALAPAYCFRENGSMRPWAIPFLCENSADSVYTPIGFFPALLGLFAALFF